MSGREAAFEAALRGACKESAKLGYYPTYFLQMLTSQGAIETAKKLVRSGDLQSGLTRLARLGHLDLSLESLMLQAEFTPLFDKETLECARWRLEQMRP